MEILKSSDIDCINWNHISVKSISRKFSWKWFHGKNSIPNDLTYTLRPRANNAALILSYANSSHHYFGGDDLRSRFVFLHLSETDGASQIVGPSVDPWIHDTPKSVKKVKDVIWFSKKLLWILFSNEDLVHHIICYFHYSYHL